MSVHRHAMGQLSFKGVGELCEIILTDKAIASASCCGKVRTSFFQAVYSLPIFICSLATSPSPPFAFDSFSLPSPLQFDGTMREGHLPPCASCIYIYIYTHIILSTCTPISALWINNRNELKCSDKHAISVESAVWVSTIHCSGENKFQLFLVFIMIAPLA